MERNEITLKKIFETRRSTFVYGIGIHGRSSRQGAVYTARIISYMEMKHVKIKKWNLHLGAHWVPE